MDDLKTLIEAVAKLPQMAIWVVVMFWAYKVVVIGSMYGLIRFSVEKAHSWATAKKYQNVEVRLLVDGEVITGTKEALMAQLGRIKKATGMYLHQSDVDWLRDAISEKLAAENTIKKPSATSAAH